MTAGQPEGVGQQQGREAALLDCLAALDVVSHWGSPIASEMGHIGVREYAERQAAEIRYRLTPAPSSTPPARDQPSGPLDDRTGDDTRCEHGRLWDQGCAPCRRRYRDGVLTGAIPAPTLEVRGKVAEALLELHGLHQPPRHGRNGMAHRRYCTECGDPYPCRSAEVLARVVRRG